MKKKKRRDRCLSRKVEREKERRSASVRKRGGGWSKDKEHSSSHARHRPAQKSSAREEAPIAERAEIKSKEEVVKRRQSHSTTPRDAAWGERLIRSGKKKKGKEGEDQ